MLGEDVGEDEAEEQEDGDDDGSVDEDEKRGVRRMHSPIHVMSCCREMVMKRCEALRGDPLELS